MQFFLCFETLLPHPCFRIHYCYRFFKAFLQGINSTMSVTVYKDTNFQGIYAQLRPGAYSGRDLVGCPHQSTSCEDLDNAINSIRVDPNTVVAFADGHAISASGGGARVLVGPAEIPDLTALGMNNRISSILVIPYRAYDSAIPAPTGGVTIYDNYSLTGRHSLLRRGDYSPARLTSEEVKLPGPSVVSLLVESGVIAILYNGTGFETMMDAVMVVGPTVIEDLDRLGMSGRVRSIRVLYSDPFDIPNRPTLSLGSARAYTPGGALGYVGGARAPYARPSLSTGALDLLVSDDPDPSSPKNWAGDNSPSVAPPGAMPPGAMPLGAAPQIIYYIHDNDHENSKLPRWMIFALIVIFIFVIGVAAYLAAKVSKSKVEKEAAEATLVAQAAVPLALSTALM